MGSTAEIGVEGEVVFYDGECKFCDAAVQFVLNKERDHVLRFAPLQSDLGKRTAEQIGDPKDVASTIIFLKHGQVFIRSTAVFLIAEHLAAPWSWISIFKVLPVGLTDACYRFLAKYRYTIFGRQEICQYPSSDVAKRFLDLT